MASRTPDDVVAELDRTERAGGLTRDAAGKALSDLQRLGAQKRHFDAVARIVARGRGPAFKVWARAAKLSG